MSFVALLSLAAPACEKPTSENIQLWKTTEKGPAKLAQTLRDGSVAPALRAESALALIDIGQWEDVIAAWTALPPDTRAPLAEAALPLTTAAMKGPAPEKALTNRDFAFFIRPDLLPASRAALDADLLAVLLPDIKVGRIRNGHTTVAKILDAIGPKAWSSVADLLGEPVVAYPAVAELIGTGGDAGARFKGGTLLVGRAKAQAHPTPELWRSLGLLGGPSAAAYLSEKLAAPGEDAVAAARVLVEHPMPEALPAALRIAGDAKADKGLRDECFGVAEAIGGPSAVTGLLAILRGAKGDKDELVRYRAFEAVVGAGKDKVLVEALDAFPPAATYKRADVDDLLVNVIVKLGGVARPALVKALSSSSAVTRMTAVLALERVGHAPDAPALEAQSRDGAVLKGFPPTQTVGHEATRVASAVKTKP